jgi:TolB-like protein
MKRCPQCNRVETEDTLAFCRADGAALVSDSLPLDSEAGTARLGSAPVATDIETSIRPHRTDAGVSRGTAPTTVLPAQPPSSRTRELTKPKRRRVLIAGVLLIAAVIGVAGYFYLTTKDKAAIQSIAVLPFENKSGNPDSEYLSDGMTETLISSLSQLPNLNVKPRSSVFRYKGKETNPQTIAKELNVQAILNGRVVQRGQDVSLYVELIDVALEKVVWSQQYNRKQSDLVTLQTDIARDVSGRLKTKLSGADEAKVTKTYTNNPEAYQLYLKGKYFYSKYNENSYQKAIDYYKQAIEIDPNYALAYHGIAEAYNTATDWYLPPNEAQPKAKAAVLKALELDSTLAQAHYTLGVMEFWYDWDWITAEREWKRASELDSSYSTYPLYLAALGRHDEAIKAQEMRQRSLPLDLQMSMDLEGVYLYAGRYDQVIAQARKTMELDQNYWAAYQDVGLAYERKKQYPEAIAALEKARSLDKNPSILGYLGYVYAAAGKKAEAQRVLDELKELSKQRYVPSYSIAIIYAGLNDKDKAFEWLNKAYDERSFFIALLKVETVLDNLRPDPRFKEMLKRLNLPE